MNVHFYNEYVAYGSIVSSTSEGLIFQVAKNLLYSNDSNFFGGTTPFFSLVEADMTSGRIALSISYQPESITI